MNRRGVVQLIKVETHFIYDAMWNLARITEPNGVKTRGRNANGDVVCYTYDANGNRIKMGELAIKSLMGGATQTAFDATIGDFFDSATGETGDIATKAILKYFKSVYDVGGSTVSEMIYLIFNNKDKVKVVPACMNKRYWISIWFYME